MITMPEARPEEHRYRARLEGVVLPGAGFRVQIELRYLGEPARAARANARAGLSDRVQALQSEIRETWTGAAFDEHAVNEDLDTGEFVETISWMAARLPGAGGSIPLFFIPSAWVPEPSLSQRSQPVIFDFPYSIDATSVWTGVPHGMVFDTPVDRAIDGASARVEAITKGGELHANVSITMARRRFEAEAMRDLRRFYAGARAARSFTARVP
ncbi:MAG: hypothetical protein HC882_03195 [Acidobacteria bacterium]|nr:hypothetical protein [Acidobacteriota bacterium]